MQVAGYAAETIEQGFKLVYSVFDMMQLLSKVVYFSFVAMQQNT